MSRLFLCHGCHSISLHYAKDLCSNCYHHTFTRESQRRSKLRVKTPSRIRLTVQTFAYSSPLKNIVEDLQSKE